MRSTGSTGSRGRGVRRVRDKRRKFDFLSFILRMSFDELSIDFTFISPFQRLFELLPFFAQFCTNGEDFISNTDKVFSGSVLLSFIHLFELFLNLSETRLNLKTTLFNESKKLGMVTSRRTVRRRIV